MVATLEAESTLTDRYQTTVPETVRRALKRSKRDKIHYSIRSSGEVVLTRVDATEVDDPVLGPVVGPRGSEHVAGQDRVADQQQSQWRAVAR